MTNRTSYNRSLEQSWQGSTPVMTQGIVLDQPCRTWVVNPQEVVRVGLEQFVRRHEGLRYQAGLASLEQAVTDISRHRAAVIIVDQSCWTVPSERRVLERLKRKSGHRVIMVLESPSQQIVIDVLGEQFAAVLLRSSSYDQFGMAMDDVLRGRCYVDPSLTPMLLAHLRKASTPEESTAQVLSVQEYRILPLLSEGKTNKEIGRALGLSDKTIKNYLANIFSKLQVSRRTQVAARYAEGSVIHK